MRIHFEDEGGWCITPCPFGVMNGYTGEPRTVGSNYCADCRHFVDIDNENNIVECLFEEDGMGYD